MFAGAGGLSLGFEQAGFVSVLGVDSDERALTAYKTNFPDSAVLAADARALRGEGLLDAAGRSSYGVLIGGPPCAAFSIGGVMRQDDDRRGLVGEFGRIIRETSPPYFVMENVPGILLPNARKVVEEFRRELKSAGYNVGKPWLLDSADFGVPQRRRRVFMVGARKGLPIPKKPQPSGAEPPTARDAIGDLEFVEKCRPGTYSEHDGQLGKASSYAALLRGDRKDGTDHSRPRARPLVLTGCDRVRHTPAVEERFRSVVPGTSEPISRFLRLHPDRPAPTIRAGTLPSHGSHTAPRPIHYAFPRVITVREAARIQSMPDWFWVDPTKWRGYMQVGNAVPPLLARAVATAVRRALEDHEAENT